VSEHPLSGNVAKSVPVAPDDRRRALLGLVRAEGRLSVQQLSEHLGVSVETLRRDVRVLEDAGLLERVGGVVMPVESSSYETGLQFRSQRDLEEKRRICAEVVRRLGEAQTVFIDEGFHPLLLAQSLPEKRELVIVTASVPIAYHVADRPNLHVQLLGGRVRGNTLGTVGPSVEDALSQLHLDLAVIGANGVSDTGGMTTPDEAVAKVKRTAMGVSRRRLFMGAHHEFGVTAMVQFAKLTDFEAVVTGRELTAARARRFVDAGAALVRV